MQSMKKEVTHPRKEELYARALRFSRDIYETIKQFPDYEENNMRDQLRRASSSVGANFAEGYGNYYFGKERDRLNSSVGSITECQFFLDLACMVKYITREEHDKLDDDAQTILDMLKGKMGKVNENIEEGGEK